MGVYIFMVFLEEEKLFFQRLNFTLHIQASNVGVINDFLQTCNISFHGLPDGHLILKPITHKHIAFQVMHYKVSKVNSPPSRICEADDFWLVYFVILKMTTFSEACSFDSELQDAFLRCLWCGVVMETDLTLKSSTARRALSICRTRRALSTVASNTYRQNKAHISPNKTCF